MQTILNSFRSNRGLAIAVGVVSGIMLDSLYDWIRVASMPLNLTIFSVIASPNTGFIGIAAINFLFVLLVGTVSSIVVLTIMHLLFKPTRMLPLLASVSAFFALNIFQTLGDWKYIAADELQYVLLKLLYPIGVASIFLIGSSLLVRRNRASKSLNLNVSSQGDAAVC